MTLRREKIGLGTVQWGMDYGVSNSKGQTPPDEVRKVLAGASAAGLKLIDTAALYGGAEAVLGQYDLREFRLVTKTPRYERSCITQDHADDLRIVFERSLERMGVDSVYGLMVHNAGDVTAPGGELLIRAMSNLKSLGLVRRIGVSVYDPEELRAVQRVFLPDLVQLPLNVFDQRFLRDGALRRLRQAGTEVHARSALLQGLLVLDPDDTDPYFQPWRELLRRWQAACLRAGVQPQHAALAFVTDCLEVDCCVVGVESLQQLRDLLAGLDNVPDLEWSSFACDIPALLNPSQWRLE